MECFYYKAEKKYVALDDSISLALHLINGPNTPLSPITDNDTIASGSLLTDPAKVSADSAFHTCAPDVCR